MEFEYKKLYISLWSMRITYEAQKAFTLIEMLIVISIAAILATVTLQLNRSRISEMQALSERENRIDQHNHINRELTNTNYMSWQKISSMTFNYIHGADIITLSWFDSMDTEIFATKNSFQYHTLSWSVIIKKTPLSLWCTIIQDPDTTNNSWTLYLINKKSGKEFCFQLNMWLCSRSKCQ